MAAGSGYSLETQRVRRREPCRGLTVQQDPESFIWAVSEPLNGVHWTFVTEADAREAAGALQALVSADVMVPLRRLDDVDEQAGQASRARTVAGGLTKMTDWTLDLLVSRRSSPMASSRSKPNARRDSRSFHQQVVGDTLVDDAGSCGRGRMVRRPPERGAPSVTRSSPPAATAPAGSGNRAGGRALRRGVAAAARRAQAEALAIAGHRAGGDPRYPG